LHPPVGVAHPDLFFMNNVKNYDIKKEVKNQAKKYA